MIIAIDPGLSGGIAYKDGELEYAVKMPDTIKGIIDLLQAIRFQFEDGRTGQKHYCSAICYLEDVHSMPKQGVKSMWTFGEHYGALQAILLCLGIPMKTVTPNTWQKAIGASRPSVPKDATPSQREAAKREGKHKIKQIVEARFPTLQVTLKTADALGILIYAIEKERANK